MKYESVSAVERLAIATKPYLTTNDIAKFVGCGPTKACALMNEMHMLLLERGKKPIKGHISKGVFQEYFEVNMDDLTQEAKDWAEIQTILGKTSEITK